MSTPARHQSTTPRHRLGQAPDQHHARAIIHRIRTEGTPRETTKATRDA